MTKRTLVLVLGSLLGSTVLALTAGCEHDHAHGKPTGTVCPTASSWTYDNFGQGFLNAYCQTCHGSTVTGADRHGAPADHTFDQLADIRSMAEHMDEVAGAGPSATNTFMPPVDPRPTDLERRALSEWLTCGAP